MKYVLLSILAITLLACGKSGAPASPSNVTPAPGPLPNQTVYTFTASRSEPGDANNQASQSFTTTGSITVPSNASALSDIGESIYSTLNIGSVVCTYLKGTGSNSYIYHDCTSGYTPGQTITFPNNTIITFQVSSGYCTQNCQAQLVITVTQ